jgi:superfamily I DNA/RNA helicase
VFEEYRRQMATRQLKDVDDAYREIALLLSKEAEEADTAGKEWPGLYPSIVIDETQDFGPQALKLLRAMVPPSQNDLFFVGDGHQRIYPRNRAAMGRCGIDIRGRSRKLYLNYRTTAEIRNQAVALLEGVEVDDLDDSHDELRRYKSLSHGPKPTVYRAGSTEAAVDAVVQALESWHRQDTEFPDPSGHVPTMAALARTGRQREEIGRRCAAIGLACVVVDKDQGADMQPGVIRLATLHRAKGLEFDRVAVLGESAALGPAEDTAQERSLLYVALTRARREAALVFC